MLKRQIWREPWPELTSVPALSIAYRLTLVASGGIDAAFALTGKWIWDVAAGALIAKEAGAAVTDPYGKPLVFSDPTEKVKGYLASTPGLQPLLLPRMKQGAEALKSQMKDRR
jgi:myo-inositol-1(or 4)-monophosphatase